MICNPKKRRAIASTVPVMTAFIILTAVCAIPAAALTWNIEEVQRGTPGNWPVNYVDSLVLDSSGDPHVVYYDLTDDDADRLVYGEKIGDDWSLETIETIVNMSPYSALALDLSDTPHVCYFNATSLVHAWREGGEWQREVVGTSRGMHLSGAFDPSGDLHLVYYNTTLWKRALRYAVWDGGAWTDEEIVPRSNQLFSSLAIDDDGAVHVAYIDGNTGELMYSLKDESGWNPETVADGVGVNDGTSPGYTSIALDGNGMPAIAYYNLDSETLGYAWQEDGVWRHEDVAAAKGDHGDRASLAFDGKGLPAIAFTSVNATDVMVTYAWREDGIWEFSRIIDGGRQGSGGYPDLAMTADGSPRISCRTGPHDSVEYIWPVPEPFAANFSASVTSGHAPLNVTFTDESTGGPDTWAWDFGDGETAMERHPEHLYPFAGVYDVSLTISGASGDATLVREGYVTVLPLARFSANVTSGLVPLAVLFTDESTGGPDTWAWDFGDGNTSTEPEGVHVYEEVGNYSVSLMVAKGELSNTTVLADEIVVLAEPTTEPTAGPTTEPTTEPTAGPTTEKPPSQYSGGGGKDRSYAYDAVFGLKPGENTTLHFDRSAISEFTFTAVEGIEGIMVTLEPVGEAPLDFDGPVYQYIEVTLSYADEDALKKTTFFFDIPRSWLASEDLGTGDIVLWYYDSGKWRPLVTELIRVNDDRAYYRAHSTGFSYFAIAAGEGMTLLAVESSASAGEVVEVTTEPPVTSAPTTSEPPLTTVAETTATTSPPATAQPSPAGFAAFLVSFVLVVLVLRRR